MRKLEEIIVHCSATKPSMNIGAAEIRKWHVEERGWDDIGYHYVIRRDGSLEFGRPLTEVGAHAFGHNENTVGVCLEGGMSEEGKDQFNFGYAQLTCLAQVRQWLKMLHGVSKIKGHNQVSDKPCPMFDVEALFSGG